MEGDTHQGRHNRAGILSFFQTVTVFFQPTSNIRPFSLQPSTTINVFEMAATPPDHSKSLPNHAKSSMAWELGSASCKIFGNDSTYLFTLSQMKHVTYLFS
jgi:hypothetical protein